MERGELEAILKGREIAQLRGQQKTAQAANGVYGASNDRTLADTDLLGAEDMGAIRENANRESQGFRISAANYEAERRAQKRQARNAVISTVFDVGTTLLGGAQQIGGMPGGWASKGRGK